MLSVCFSFYFFSASNIQTGLFIHIQIGFWNEISLSLSKEHTVEALLCASPSFPYPPKLRKFEVFLIFFSRCFHSFYYCLWLHFRHRIQFKKIPKCSYHHHSVNLYTWVFRSFTQNTLFWLLIAKVARSRMGTIMKGNSHLQRCIV